jgi:predicted  nucleic acid-binding Zn ribbon protein
LIGALVRNGNLVEGCLLAADRKGWSIHGVTPARDGLRVVSWNETVRSRIRALADVKLKPPQVRFLGTVPETAPACKCSRQRGFLLFTTFLHTEPPLRCLYCYGTVPLYRLPRPANEEHPQLLSWLCNYRACDTLQINCTVGEKFGERQMSDVDSSLSRSGLAVCREIERLSGQPTYYYLFRGGSCRRLLEVSRRCPSCGGPWILSKPLHGKFDFKCDKCRLLSNISWHVR